MWTKISLVNEAVMISGKWEAGKYLTCRDNSFHIGEKNLPPSLLRSRLFLSGRFF